MSVFDDRYPFMTAYLKGEEAQVVTSDHVDRLSRVTDVEQALEEIRDTDLGDCLNTTVIKTFDDLDEKLWAYLSDTVARLKWFKPVPADILKIVTAYLVKYDLLNIKAALLALTAGDKASLVPLGTIHDSGLLEELGAAETVADISQVLDRCRLSDYAVILADYQADAGARARLLMEAKLDREYYQHLVAISAEVADGEELARVIGIMIDMTDLKMLLRAVADETGAEAAGYILGSGYLAPGENISEVATMKLNEMTAKVAYLYRSAVREVSDSYDKTRNVTTFDEIIERNKFALLKGILSVKIMSPLMIIWYLILKENEVRNIRIILKTLFDGGTVEGIKNSLVLAS